MGTEICNLILLGVKIKREELLRERFDGDFDKFHDWKCNTAEIDHNVYENEVGDFIHDTHMDNQDGYYYFGKIIEKQYDQDDFTGLDLTEEKEKNALEVSEKLRGLGILKGDIRLYSICALH